MQNEAVVAEILRKANDFSPGSLELIDAHAQLPELKKRHGLKTWPVLVEKKTDQKIIANDDSSKYKVDDVFKVYHFYSELPDEHKNLKCRLLLIKSHFFHLQILKFKILCLELLGFCLRIKIRAVSMLRYFERKLLCISKSQFSHKPNKSKQVKLRSLKTL